MISPPGGSCGFVQYHANVWWGALLLLLGLLYCVRFAPRKADLARFSKSQGMFMANRKMTMGLIVGNRGFFPDHLAKSGREEMLAVTRSAGMDVVALTPEQSKHGAVETREEARRCADLFKKNRDRIDGIIVTLPNFGEERAIADTLRLADLRVPC